MYDCTIIGGGIIGLMTARELLLAGLKVAVIDKGRAGMECSWAGGGILSPLYPWRESTALAELTLWSQQFYPDLANKLHAATGIDPEWQRCGMKIIATAEQDEALAWATSHTIPIDVSSSDDALWLPDTAQIRNPALISALKKYLQQAGVEIHEYTTVARFRIHNHQVEAIETSRGIFKSTVTVLANGAWGADLLPDLDIRPVRGQMICYQAMPGYIRHILLKNSIYIIPRRDGHILVGSTVEDVGFEKGTTEAARTFLAESAEDMLPGINHFPVISHWSGLRPATQTGLPYICKHSELNGLFLNIGHHRNGILLAPGSARLLTDIILDRETTMSAAAFQICQN